MPSRLAQAPRILRIASGGWMGKGLYLTGTPALPLRQLSGSASRAPESNNTVPSLCMSRG